MSNTVGTATAGQQLKARWHKEGRGLSLKQFARKLVAAGDTVASTWFEMKRGLHNQERTEKNINIARASAQATKNSRGKG
jgi:hypothetical protein